MPRFDLTTSQIGAAIPTIQFGDHFLEENTNSNGSGDISCFGGFFWLADPQTNGGIIRIGPTIESLELA